MAGRVAIKIAYFQSHYDENWLSIEAAVRTQRIYGLHHSDRLVRCGEVVFVTPKTARIPGVVSLLSFVHPNDATYLFGPSHRDLDEVDLKKHDIAPDHLVYIPYEPEWLGSQAAAIVLYDRMVKRGSYT